jgi:hypothetical protein
MPWKVNWRLVVFSVLVCIASGVVGLVFGTLASIPYSGRMGEHTRNIAHGGINLVEAGMAFGGSSGVLAGVLWCGIMVLRVLPKPAPRRIASLGMLWGLVVGVLSTCILHLGLKMMAPPEVQSALLVGLMFGIPAGLVMGLICGAILKAITLPALPAEQPQTQDAQP